MSADLTAYQLLRDIHGDVNASLQHAEAKNGILVTVNFAVVIGLLTITTSDNGLPGILNPIAHVVCVGLILSGFVAFVSFFPDTSNHSKPRKTGSKFLGNFMFFKDISGSDPQCYLEAILTVAPIPGCHAPVLSDLSNQIVTISRIALRKFTFFAYALSVTTAFVLFAGLAYLLSFLPT